MLVYDQVAVPNGQHFICLNTCQSLRQHHGRASRVEIAYIEEKTARLCRHLYHHVSELALHDRDLLQLSLDTARDRYLLKAWKEFEVKAIEQRLVADRYCLKCCPTVKHQSMHH